MIGKAHQGLEFCNRLFAIEREMNRRQAPLTPEERHVERQAHSRAIVAELHAWLGAMQPIVVPKSALGKAVTYCLNQWEKLGRFLEDGRLEIDNNRAERSIKPFVIGRNYARFSVMEGLDSRIHRRWHVDRDGIRQWPAADSSPA